MAPERDRVAVQGGQRPRGHADVEAAALPSAEDLGGEDVIGDAEARAERRGRQRDRRATPGVARASASAAAGSPDRRW